MDAYTYVRVSKELQAVNGISLEAQTDMAERWASLYGHAIVQVFSDEDSCRTTNRPCFQAMIRELMLGKVKMVIVYRLDRLFGNTLEALGYSKKFQHWGVQLASISEQLDTTTPAGRYMFTNWAALGELRVQEIGARTKMALAYLKGQGLKYSGVPYGYRQVPTDEKRRGKPVYRLELNPVEQAVIAQMIQFRKDGWGYRRIAKLLNATGVPTKKGKSAKSAGVWYPSTVRDIFMRCVSSEGQLSADRPNSLSLPAHQTPPGAT